MKNNLRLGKRGVYERYFQCPTCKHTYIAYKSSSKRTAEGHIKTMWCSFCKKQQQMVQYTYNPPAEGDE